MATPRPDDSLDQLAQAELAALVRVLMGEVTRLISRSEELEGALAKLKIEHQAVKDERWSAIAHGFKSEFRRHAPSLPFPHFRREPPRLRRPAELGQRSVISPCASLVGWRPRA